MPLSEHIRKRNRKEGGMNAATETGFKYKSTKNAPLQMKLISHEFSRQLRVWPHRLTVQLHVQHDLIVIGLFLVAGGFEAFPAPVPRDQFLLRGLCRWLWKHAPLQHFLTILLFDRTPPFTDRDLGSSEE